MGALTLGIVLPAGPAKRSRPSEPRARSAESSWTDVERRSAADLAEAATVLGHAVEFVIVPALSDDGRPELGPVVEILRRRLSGMNRVIVAAHGELGGSGRLHAAARACGLPVLGPEAAAIELAFDKLRSRARLDEHNVPVPRSVLATEAADLLGWPCVLKPRRGVAGSGLRRLGSQADVQAALSEAGTDMLLEREVVGREFSVVLLDGQVLGIAELERGEWSNPTTTVSTPARLDAVERVGLENVARRACAALGLGSAPTRVDLIVSERGNEVVLEVEPLPPLHRDGLVARVARAAGLTYPRLCAQLLAGPIGAPARARASTVAAPTPRSQVHV